MATQTMTPETMTPELLELIAGRFKVLAEPARLQILNALRAGEMTVTELIEATGIKQANVSKHLQLLYAAGFVDRRKVGLHVYYHIADEGVFQLCQLVCGRLRAETDERQALLAQR
jgi:ArsR family transcriptional regulator